MRKWYFPYGKDIEKESVNNARIETFRDNILESLTREICQNSLDASSDSNKPVKVSFNQKLVGTHAILDRESFKKYIIPKARKTWKNDKNAQEFLNFYENILNQRNIKILKISDYNTTGLMEENWESLIENAGISVKADISSAGSFGIGKAAPFASSDLRMVFYNTKLKNGEEKSIGVTKFVSYDRPDGMTAQGVGYLGEGARRPMRNQISFGFEERTECGTDIYVIGFNQDNCWKNVMVGSVLENFLISIYNEKLVVDVEGTIIDKNTMGELIAELDDRRYKQIKNYHSVLVDDNAKEIYLDDRFIRFGFEEKDGVLLLSKGEMANRSILMTRKAGMKILDRKNIHGSIQFNGIFQAEGEKFNEVLKEMENPNHNDWIATRYTKNPREAKRLLDAIYRFIKDNVIKHYQEKIEESVDAFGIKDFLPNNLDKDTNNEDGDKEKGSLDNHIEEVILKPRKVKRTMVEGVSGQDVERDMIRSGIIDGDETGPGTPKDSLTKTKGNGNNQGVGNPGGDNKEDPDGEKVVIAKRNRFEESDRFQTKLIERDYRNGEYRLILMGNTKSDKLKIQINLVSETGYNYKDNLEAAYFNKQELKVINDHFILENPTTETNLINFKIPHSNRIRMGVRIYENKR